MKQKLILFSALLLLNSCSKDEEITSNECLRQRPNLPLVSKKIRDIDGNVYNTIIIGNQTWTAENLKTTHYRNGDPIDNLTSNNDWVTATTGAWCYYNNDSSYNNIYGKLYNAYTVVDSRNIAPPGWHIPTQSDWNKLIIYLDSLADTTWLVPSYTAAPIFRNQFNGIYSGVRFPGSGSFYHIERVGNWWSSTQTGSIQTNDLGYYACGVQDITPYIYLQSSPVTTGLSIRLIKD